MNGTGQNGGNGQRPWWIALIALMAVIACGPAVRSTPFGTFPARPADHPIEIYSTKIPECEYEEVGLVSARQRFEPFTSMTDVLEALKEQARVMGGDAVIGVSEGVEVSGGGGEGNGLSSDPVLSGTVIRFADDGCTR